MIHMPALKTAWACRASEHRLETGATEGGWKPPPLVFVISKQSLLQSCTSGISVWVSRSIVGVATSVAKTARASCVSAIWVRMVAAL